MARFAREAVPAVAFPVAVALPFAWVAFSLVLLGVRDGWMRRRIRTNKYSATHVATGPAALVIGLLYVAGGVAVAFAALLLWGRGFGP